MTVSMELPEIFLHGVRINPISKQNFLDALISLVDEKIPGRYVVTPYSEFVLTAQSNTEFLEALNSSDISIADGIYIQWATKFMSMPIKHSGYLGKLTVLVQYVITGASIILKPSFVRTVIPERIPGSQIVYDISRVAADKGYKIAILGGFDFGSGNTGTLAAERLRALYPGLQIVEVYPGNRDQEEYGAPVVEVLKKSDADILFCCYGPVKEEIWLKESLPKTGITVGIGLGGTLDYISGVKKAPPRFVSKLGLEWLFRPFLAEGRSIKRMGQRMKRGWVPAMLKSSLYSLKQKLKTVH